MEIRIVADGKELTATLPCALTVAERGMDVIFPGGAGELVRLTSQQGTVYMVSRAQETLLDGRRVVTGLAKLTPGLHRIVVGGARAAVEVPIPSLRVVAVEEHPLDDCPVHHGPPSGQVAVCEKCGFVCCAECGARRCPRCGSAGTNPT